MRNRRTEENSTEKSTNRNRQSRGIAEEKTRIVGQDQVAFHRRSGVGLFSLYLFGVNNLMCPVDYPGAGHLNAVSADFPVYILGF